MYLKTKIIAITLFSTIYYICGILTDNTIILKSEYQVLNRNKRPLKKVIAVIGTGINCNDTFIKKNLYNKCGFEMKDGFFESVSEMSDDNGHEHFITSQILAINPEARIIPIKIPLHNGSFRESDIIKALELVNTLEEVNIVNISINSSRFKNDKELMLLTELTNKKTVVMSAGNDGDNLDLSPRYPVSYNLPKLIKVGGRHIKANFGSVVDIYPNGSDLLGLSTNGELVRKSGTSFSTAVITGLISLEKEFDKSKLLKFKELVEFEKASLISSIQNN